MSQAHALTEIQIYRSPSMVGNSVGVRHAFFLYLAPQNGCLINIQEQRNELTNDKWQTINVILMLSSTVQDWKSHNFQRGIKRIFKKKTKIFYSRQYCYINLINDAKLLISRSKLRLVSETSILPSPGY